MTIIKSLQKRYLYRYDPLAYWLLEKLNLSPVSFGLLSIIIGVSLYLVTALLSDTLWSKPDQIGLLRDWFPWIWVLFVNPIVLGYYLWSFQAIDQVIQNLEASDVLDIDESEAKEINQIALNAYHPKWRRLLAIISAVSFSLFVLMTRSKLSNSWTSSHPLVIGMITLTTFLVVYMGSMLVLNLMANIWILHHILKRELKRKQFNINPLHPDRCGGLRSLSDYALKTAYLVAVLSIMTGFILFQFITRGDAQSYWFVYLIIPLDILLSIVCFFGPLVAAHRGMQKAKEELLHEIAKQFQVDYTQIHSSLTGDATDLKKGAEKIKELREFYTLTNEFPVWPFDIKTFQRFLLTVSASLFPLLLGLLKNLSTLLLKKWGIELD